MATAFVEKCSKYSVEEVLIALNAMDALFSESIKPDQIVVIKPNWIAPGHKYKKAEWQYVITHPIFLQAVLIKILSYMNGSGKVIIADAPQTDVAFERILERMPVSEWIALGKYYGTKVEVVDLRDHEWIEQDDVIVSRRELPGDPLGSVEFNLGDFSEFKNYAPSSKGFYGADYDINETTKAHTGGNHIYKLSRTVIKADVLVNLPKLKTHKKAGITCALKNLVGANTYKNLLPHHSEGTPDMGGDQFPDDRLKSMIEVHLLEKFKGFLLKHQPMAIHMKGVKKIGKILFGETTKVIRSGNWYGNNTLWRTILDLNKIVMYGNPDGSLRESHVASQKPVLCFVDGIISGQGNGPEAPDPVMSHLVCGGKNPVAVDCLSAKLMGFDYTKIPALQRSFKIEHFPLVNFLWEEIEVVSQSLVKFNGFLKQIPKEECFSFKPHFGWIGHIEMQ